MAQPSGDSASLAWPHGCKEFHLSPFPPRKFSYFLAYKRFNFMWSNPSIFSFRPHFVPFKLGKTPQCQGAGNQVYLVPQESLRDLVPLQGQGGSLERAPGLLFSPRVEGRGLPSALPPRPPALGSLLIPGPVPKPPRLLAEFTTQDCSPENPTTPGRPCMSSLQPIGLQKARPTVLVWRPDSYGSSLVRAPL